jgi:hypothetical protein
MSTSWKTAVRTNDVAKNEAMFFTVASHRASVYPSDCHAAMPAAEEVP